MGVFTRQNLACVGDITAHGEGRREGNFLGSEATLGGGFGRAHLKKTAMKSFAAEGCQPAIVGSTLPRLRN